MPTVYRYAKCSTCRDALKWLDAHKVNYTLKEIRETPPTKKELETALRAMNGQIRKIINTSGMDYREMGLKEKLDAGMSEKDVLELLTKNGNLVKRPFVIGDGVALAGFKEEEWKKVIK